jgi:type III secretion system FlhB-like substrate exporter
VGEMIPPKLYRAVAKLLVHIFKLKGKDVSA